MTQTQTPWAMPIGALPDDTGTRFRVWASNARRGVSVVLYANDGQTITATHPLTAEGNEYYCAHIAGVRPGTRYMYRVDEGDPRPDPASRSQPAGVHRASAVVDVAGFPWTDAAWRGLPMHEMVIYEVHVGTATPAGTFDALIERLDYLQDLGITAIELMPIADFPGERNWGYDGVNLFAPARAYGGATALQRLVDAAHARGLAVLLDVVYNHFGPDGNYLRQFSTAYFTSRHHTPWGEALNMDGDDSRPVRDYFLANVLSWAHDYHLDGLRLDATHALLDDSPTHILAELATSVRDSLPTERHFVLIAENEENDPHLVRPAGVAPGIASGLGLDGVWADDFHHQVRVALTGEREGYYRDFGGTASELATTLMQGWFYTGQYSQHLEKPRGAPASDVPLYRFVYCIQNHDQVGNRAFGERLHHEVDLTAYRAASTLLLLAPATPLLFMGQEWATSVPFLFFTDHNPELGRLVTEGRRAEFASFAAFAATEVPDPQARSTFEHSKLPWDELTQPPFNGMHALYRALLALRRERPELRDSARELLWTTALQRPESQTLVLRRTAPATATALLVIVHLTYKNVPPTPLELRPADYAPQTTSNHHKYALLLDSEAEQFGGAGGPVDTTLLQLDTSRALVIEFEAL